MTIKADSQKRHISDVLEETFKRYEPKDEFPPFPVIGEEIQRIPIADKAAEKTATLAEIPPQQIFSTGIAGLDNILGGGIADHSLITVFGDTGSHYNTFIQQILYNHTIEKGKTAYYNAETLSLDIRQDMEKFNWRLQSFLSKGMWTFTNLRTKELQQLADLAPKQLSDSNNIKLTQGLSSLKNDLLTKIKENHWTALELSYLLLNFDLKEITDLILYWRAVARIHGGVHFAIIPTGIHPDNQTNAIKTMADGVLEFSLREAHHEYETVMAVRKMKGMLKSLITPFTVEENGINIETAARIA